MQKTGIEYLTHTWNPIAMKCTPVSAGCANCWHLRMAKRLATNILIPNLEMRAFGGDIPVQYRNQLYAPLRLRKPARIGVQFMGDLFYEKIVDCMIDDVFGMMSSAINHTFFILTKRPERLHKYMSAGDDLWADRWAKTAEEPTVFPLKNVWLGVSVEDQKTADERIPLLLNTPAAHRWVSYEPALGQVDFKHYLLNPLHEGHCACRGVHWIVMGGETGPKARPMHPNWARSVVKQCEVAGVPFFFKSWGNWWPAPDGPKRIYREETISYTDGQQMVKGNPRKSGHLIDGKAYRHLPEGA